jgi:nicotinamide-nucleotide amidase
VAIATSGIAGPQGGSPDKPVGTVCLGLVGNRIRRSRRYQLRGTRDWIKLLTSQIALDWLRRYALDLPFGESAAWRR